MSYNYSYTFPALRGLQAGQIYYVAMCPLKLLPKLFLFDEAEVPPELRAQRTLNASRVPEISRYILENYQDYAFSAITASIDGEVRFDPIDPEVTTDVGRLVIPMSARFIINDGQHRRAAIEVALETRPELGEETIAVVFYLDVGLQRSQQLFADLNKHAVRPTKSIGILYDNRDPLSRLARSLVDQAPFFRGLVETEETTISNRSTKLFTLSSIYQATSALLGTGRNQAVSEEDQHKACRFWMELGGLIPEWQLAAKRQVSTFELRRDYVHSHGVVLHALGIAGHSLTLQYPEDWVARLQAIEHVDWLRSNKVWEGRALSKGQMSRSHLSVQLTAAYLKQVLGLSLTQSEKQLEDRLAVSRQSLQGTA